METICPGAPCATPPSSAHHGPHGFPRKKSDRTDAPCLAASARLNTPKNDRCSPSPKREKSGKITPSKNTSKGEKNLKKKKKFLYVEKMIYICM